VTVNQTVSDAVELMRKYDIEQIPVLQNGEPVYSVSENGLFLKLFGNPDIKHATVETVVEPAFPVVAFDTPVERLSSLITKDNGAVLAKDEK
ncbi:CBS domain-containing protein, partial [Pseudomonas sp. MPR-R1B]|uniref:CBS domain-containing protein n=1 Tax=Pseudomonas sp. MPR-R1B TaxID=2070678 RepID=UPI001C46DD16